MARPPFTPNPIQAQALEALGAARELERIALDLAKEQGTRLWHETREKYRPAVGHRVKAALDLGVPKRHIEQTLGSKHHGVIPRYLAEIPVDKH